MSIAVNITPRHARWVSLGELAYVRSGYSFRSAIDPAPPGHGVAAVQLRDIEDSQRVDWSKVTRTALPHLPDSREWLSKHDILFAFRGTRYFAVCLDEVPERAVVSPHFMLVRVQDHARILPTFLAWQLNQARAQTYFQKSARGTAQKSVRRSAVAMTSIAVPEVSFQHAVVEIDQLARRERKAYEELIEIRRLQLREIAASVFDVADDGSLS